MNNGAQLQWADRGGVRYLHYAPWTNSGLLHGFTGSSLNFRGEALGASAGRLLGELGVRRLHLLRQVRGSRILDLRSPPQLVNAWCGLEGEVVRSEDPADGWFLSGSLNAGEAYGVLTADCAPVMMRRAGSGAPLALVHAGWRGLAAGIVESAAALAGGEMEGIVGPCAGIQRYEVGQEVIAALGDRAVFKAAPAGKSLLSVAQSAARALERSGCTVLHCSPYCTIERRDFHSFRREGEAMGLNLAFVAVPA